MVKVKVNMLKCLRCGHRWVARIANVKICPKCKNPRWNVRKNLDRKKRR